MTLDSGAGGLPPPAPSGRRLAAWPDLSPLKIQDSKQIHIIIKANVKYQGYPTTLCMGKFKSRDYNVKYCVFWQDFSHFSSNFWARRFAVTGQS